MRIKLFKRYNMIGLDILFSGYSSHQLITELSVFMRNPLFMQHYNIGMINKCLELEEV
jgi:hypothetical protein